MLLAFSSKDKMFFYFGFLQTLLVLRLVIAFPVCPSLSTFLLKSHLHSQYNSETQSWRSKDKPAPFLYALSAGSKMAKVQLEQSGFWDPGSFSVTQFSQGDGQTQDSLQPVTALCNSSNKAL